MGGAYEFAKCASANLRRKDDSVNPMIGGFFAGSILGLRGLPLSTGNSSAANEMLVRTVPAVLGYGALLAVTLGAFDYTGGVLTGYSKDPTVDEVDRKEYLRKNRRRPIQQTVEELGEGRGLFGLADFSTSLMGTGIYGPGYAERRAQRIKEHYGIDVPA